ncbi:hypothetical protein L3V64_004095, partial [Geobacillus stearothermophilus]|nr:hypothetical protein [Geobacillus stearothermophilus]
KANMATKQELEDIKANMATKQELEDIKANMATKQELEDVKNNLMKELDHVKANMVTKQEFVFLQQAVLETNEIVKKIEQNMEKHERILDLLSRRSIEHEAAISSIRLIKTT